MPHSSPKVLMVDVGGSNVKMMVSGDEEVRRFPSGKMLTGRGMVAQAREVAADWEFDVVTIGFPGLVRDGKLVREPLNLCDGWLKFDFSKAFGKPVQIINDAALQALANYRGGRMLFVGFGTSVGCSLVADDTIIPLELGMIPFSRKHKFMTRLSKAARRKYGHEIWQEDVHEALVLLQDIFWPSDTVIGGGNAKHLDPLPGKSRRSSNSEAIAGAVRLWKGADAVAKPHGTTWRIEWNRRPGPGKG